MAKGPPPDLRVPGFRAAGVACGIKPSGAPDLGLVVSDAPATLAGVFTRSSLVGAPVEWCRDRARKGSGRGVVVNSGIANVGLGARGLRDTREMAQIAARALGCATEELCVASTGVIGHPLPMPKLRRGIPRAVRALGPEGLGDAAEAIRTTDTVAKTASARVRVGGEGVRVAGIAKGSGMIEPRMATMLAFLFTDASASAPVLRRVLREVADRTFNRVTVDGETSTSDTVLLMASWRAPHRPLRRADDPGVRGFREAVEEVATSLSRQIARDGEGATKLVTVEVRGARSAAEAERAARRIANSMLVKTALFGADPNWGRILQTLGAGQVTVRLERAEIALGGVVVYRRGAPAGAAARRRAARALGREEVTIRVGLGAGRAAARIWTCDLSTDYVRINAEYTT